LRWAITEVDPENNQVKVEAIVTTASWIPVPIPPY
jgi:hypothetical protein